jgi:hypothetical protein
MWRPNYSRLSIPGQRRLKAPTGAKENPEMIFAKNAQVIRKMAPIVNDLLFLFLLPILEVSLSFIGGHAMRLFPWSGCVLGLLLAVNPVPATFVNLGLAIPEMVGGVDAIVVGKISRVQPKLIRAYPERKAGKQESYQIVEVTVQEGLLGAKGLTRIKMGVPCFAVKIGNAPAKMNPAVAWQEGQEACLFLKRHYTGQFYDVGLDQLIRKQLPFGANANFENDLALVRKCAKLLRTPEKSLKSSDSEERMLTAATLIRKYRGPAPTLWNRKDGIKRAQKQEPIAAAESKLILQALAEADWSLKNEPTPSVSHPANLFRRLGLSAKDGWTLKEKQVNSFDGRAGYQAHLQLAAAAKKWLKGHLATYRIKRFVNENNEQLSSPTEKPPRDRVQRDSKNRTEQPLKDRNRPDRSNDRDALHAAAKLKLIKSLLDAGKTEAGKYRLEQLIKKYAKTPAAREARKLLKDLD